MAPRTALDSRHYKGEAALAGQLTDRDRSAQMRELFELYLAFQRDKSPEQIAREILADRRLNRARMNPRYRLLLETAIGDTGEPDAPRTIVDLIVYKKVFDRSKDIEDIKAILSAPAERLDLGRIRAGASELLDAAGASELETLIRDFYR